jgi:DNA helicase-2/ATP-dependent DNA helicase PcrA
MIKYYYFARSSNGRTADSDPANLGSIPSLAANKMSMQNNFKTRYQNLNDKQREAVDAIFGPVMVIAGPGTGKTELLSLRVANILEKTDANAESILCLTFTESGKEAMKKRLSTLIGSRADDVSIFTFHGFCGYLKSKYGEHFWTGNSFEVAGELTEYNILENILKI